MSASANTAHPTAALAAFMAQGQQRVAKRLEQALQPRSIPARLGEAMAYACLGGGKRIRPILVYAANSAVGGNLDDADNAACAVELIHSYSLVHDDLPAMDDDDLRRGKPSLHRAFDDATAILAGDALQSLAFDVLSEPGCKLDAGRQLAMVQALAVAVGPAGMVGGQVLDFSGVGQALNQQQLAHLHSLKTGALIRAAVTLGALSAPDCTDQQLTALQTYADAIGLAFQVQDDILDEIADTETLGKPQGSDSQHNKPTYVSVLGLEQAQALCSELTARARTALTGFPDSASQLRDLADYLRHRSY
jgi:geranylgeranyl pyrophosphate synthase